MTEENWQEVLRTRKPVTPFPLARRLSLCLTPALAKLPVSPNQITATSLVVGIAAAAAMMQAAAAWSIAGAIMLVVYYVLDNCDGEIAVLKNQCTAFGHYFDSVVDWVVHAAFFAALGIGVQRATGNELWLWLGLIAAAGATVNYFLCLCLELYRPGTDQAGAAPPRPDGMKEWLVYTFRELFRGDFCFIVLVLAVFDAAWLLLPAGAVGAQVYWLTRLVGRAGEFRA